MIQVILNADDFGKSEEQNQAIDDSFKQGIIGSAGLIITAKYLQDAVDKAIRGGYIEKIHLHVNLSTGVVHQKFDYIPLTAAMRNNPYSGKNGQLLWYKKKSFDFFSVFNWRQAYREIEAQYKKFIEITNGKANCKHIDFHLWYNLTWPVSVALFFFTRKYKIQSVRYIGEHQKSIRKKFFRIVSWDPNVISVPATNIDNFLTKKEMMKNTPVIELYCHPNYKRGVLMDDSDSYLRHEKKTMQESWRMLNETGDIEFVTWEDLFKERK